VWGLSTVGHSGAHQILSFESEDRTIMYVLSKVTAAEAVAILRYQ